MEKSMRLTSGEFETHCWAEMKSATLFFIHSLFRRALCDGAESCWNVYVLKPKCSRVQRFNALFKIFSRYFAALIFTPSSISTSGMRPSAVMAAHTVTLAGPCFLVFYECSYYRVILILNKHDQFVCSRFAEWWKVFLLKTKYWVVPQPRPSNGGIH